MEVNSRNYIGHQVVLTASRSKQQDVVCVRVLTVAMAHSTERFRAPLTPRRPGGRSASRRLVIPPHRAKDQSYEFLLEQETVSDRILVSIPYRTPPVKSEVVD